MKCRNQNKINFSRIFGGHFFECFTKVLDSLLNRVFLKKKVILTTILFVLVRVRLPSRCGLAELWNLIRIYKEHVSGIMREISSFNARSRKNNDDHDRGDIISIVHTTTRFTANQILD